MSIQSYAGEFTVSPIPLEMSMNYCSHKCAYCFANLNQPGRTLDVSGSINQIRNCHKSKSLTSYLLANGYPVLLSNRVDPFAKTNWRQSLSFINLFNENGNKIAFQTKGGDGIDEALSMLDYKANWYISISFWDDELRKKIEPGAPSIKDRFSLIENLISKGHHVSVGINPLVEEWLPYGDFEKLTQHLISLGVNDFWIETLHLNRKQTAAMSAKEFNNIGAPIIDEACKRNRNASYFMMCVDDLRSQANLFSMNQPYASNYFDSYHELYGDKSLKTTQDFINYCFQKYPNGGEIKFQEYYDFMSKGYFEEKFSEADGYAYRIARNVYKREVKKPLNTLKQVLEFYWDNEDVSKSLLSNALFSVSCYEEDGERIAWRCKENDQIIIYFHGQIANQLSVVLD